MFHVRFPPLPGPFQAYGQSKNSPDLLCTLTLPFPAISPQSGFFSARLRCMWHPNESCLPPPCFDSLLPSYSDLLVSGQMIFLYEPPRVTFPLLPADYRSALLSSRVFCVARLRLVLPLLRSLLEDSSVTLDVHLIPFTFPSAPLLFLKGICAGGSCFWSRERFLTPGRGLDISLLLVACCQLQPAAMGFHTGFFVPHPKVFSGSSSTVATGIDPVSCVPGSKLWSSILPFQVPRRCRRPVDLP